MEPATTTAPGFPLERVRAAFPALEREVAGRPVAYLDSGASSQRALASIEAVARLQTDGATVIFGHDAEQWAALRKGAGNYA